MKIIYSGNTLEKILVDDKDYDLNYYTWTVTTAISGGKQVMRTEYLGGGRLHRLKKNHYLGRVIAKRMGLNIEGKDIDHIDNNGLNNQRDNLRTCTPSQNAANSKMNKNNTSGYIGVHYDIGRDKYQAYTHHDSRKKFFGRYDTAIEAAVARDLGVLKWHKEFCVLNFPALRDLYEQLIKTPSCCGIGIDVQECKEILINRTADALL